MTTVTVSADSQIVVPPEICGELGLLPGAKLNVMIYRSRIELIPARDIKEMRGFLKGIDTTIYPEGEEE